MIFTEKTFRELTTQDLFEIYRLRAKVFVVEQNCVYQDVDEKDLKATHLMMSDGTELVGYARLLPPGVSYNEASVGRVVVEKKFRANGSGRMLMNYCIKKTAELFRCDEIVISAQTYLQRFYESMGFKTEGDQYPEDDIPHIRMRWKKSG